MTAFYPSCVTNMRVRFDETLQIVVSPDSATTASTGSDAQVSSPVPVRGNPPALAPLILRTGKDNLTQLFGIVPRKMSIDKSGLRQAWKFTAEYDWRDLPIDPRLIRAAVIEIHMGVVSASDFSNGMGSASKIKAAGGSRGDIAGSVPSSVLSTRKNGSPNPESLQFFGIVDTQRVDHSDTGSILVVEGRDLRGLLLDVKVPIAKVAALNITKPISQVVRDILATLPLDDDIRIEVVVDLPFLEGEPSPGDVDGLTRVRLGAAGKQATTPPKDKVEAKVKSTPPGTDSGGGDQVSYWGLIENYCFLCGCVPVWNGTRLIIRAARDIFDQLRDPNLIQRTVATLFKNGDEGTPFLGGKPRTVKYADGSTEQLRVRRLVFGRDILKLSYERKYNTVAVPTVKVVAIDDTVRGKQKLIDDVQWPPKDSPAALVKGDHEVIIIPIHGIRDRKRLLGIAHDIYEEIGRGEIGGSCATDKLASFGGDNADPDLLRTTPAEAVEFMIDAQALSSRSALVGELIEQSRRPFDEQVRFLTERLGDENLARVLAATSRGAVVDSLRFFRVNNVKLDWVGDGDSGGVSVSFDFQNYVIARHNEPFSRDPSYVAKSTTISKTGPQKKSNVQAQRQTARARVSGSNTVTPPATPDTQTRAQREASLRKLGLSDDAVNAALGPPKGGNS